MRTIHARPTTYKGIRMRSRLEAGYAAHLDSIGDEAPGAWQYEPRAYGNEEGQYLPDFMVGDRFFLEIKPTSETDLDGVLRRMHIIRDSLPSAVLVVVVGGWQNGTHFYNLARTCSPSEPCNACMLAQLKWS